MRPELTKELNAAAFKEYYWLKSELQAFCRKNGISASGSKIEISDRIEIYLQTGEIKRPARSLKMKKNIDLEADLSLDTIIPEHHRCSQKVREFFKTIIPQFHFSTYIQNFFKNNAGKTYRDAVAAWYEEEERKKDPSYKKTIGPQFEYNQFIRDYFADPINLGKRREEAIAAWNEIKRLPGSNKYKSKN